MTLSLTHTKVSAIADDATASAAGEVLPSDWNASHSISGTAGSVPFLDSKTSSTSLRQVASRGYFLTNSTAFAGNCNAQSYHFARDDITSLQVGWAGFRVDTSGVEQPNTGTNTLTAAVWYNDTAYQLTFSGSASGTIPNGGYLISDALAVTIPRGAKFYIRSYQTFSVAILTRALSASSRDVTGGDAANFVAVDKTMSGTVPDDGGGISMQWPSLILAQSNHIAVLMIGDSRLIGDGGDSYSDGAGYVGNVERSVGPYFATLNAGCDSTLASQFPGRTLTQTVFPYFTHVICEYGINDIDAGASAATLLTRLQAIYAMFSGKSIFQTTLEPNTTSTDAWVTLVNQTLHATNAARVSANTSIRAGLANVTGYFDIASALESSLNSGKWLVPSYTSDGLHANVLGNQTVVSSGVIGLATINASGSDALAEGNLVWNANANTLTIGNAAVLYSSIELINSLDNVFIGSWKAPLNSTSSNVIALSDGAGTLRLDYNYSFSDTWTFTDTLFLTGTNGSVLSTDQSLTGANASSAIFMSATWNTTGAPIFWEMNVTDTASNANSYLANWKISNVPFFQFRKDGTLLAKAALAITDDSGALFTSSGAGIVSVNSTGLYLFTSGTTWYGTADTGLGRNAAGIVEVNNGTAGTLRDLKARYAITNPLTVATLAAAGTKGRRSFVTDATATTFASIVAGTGANNVPVYDDGTNWRIG